MEKGRKRKWQNTRNAWAALQMKRRRKEEPTVAEGEVTADDLNSICSLLLPSL